MNGLHYSAAFVGQATADALLASIDAAPWLNDLRRRVQHYGYRYDYRARAARPEDYLGPLPGWADDLARRLFAEGHFEHVPDQVIVNEYEPGQGIAAHIDCEPCFGPTIASISLGSATVMEFIKAGADGDAGQREGRREQMLLEPGSLLVLSGPARYEWQHCIPARKTDPDLLGGSSERLPRGRRVSLTFRTMAFD
ncbi:MAG: alpha-ketoglutarate-dependent dioxygenase AlkB [Pseudomonadota bacterium]